MENCNFKKRKIVFDDETIREHLKYNIINPSNINNQNIFNTININLQQQNNILNQIIQNQNSLQQQIHNNHLIINNIKEELEEIKTIILTNINTNTNTNTNREPQNYSYNNYFA